MAGESRAYWIGDSPLDVASSPTEDLVRAPVAAGTQHCASMLFRPRPALPPVIDPHGPGPPQPSSLGRKRSSLGASAFVATLRIGQHSTQPPPPPVTAAGDLPSTSAPSLPPPDTEVARRSVGLLQATLDTLRGRGAVPVPEVAAALCRAALSAAAPTSTGRPRGTADDWTTVLDGSPFSPCGPGPWADPSARPQVTRLCHCGTSSCSSHHPQVDVFGIYDMHCEFVCTAHRRGDDGLLVEPAAHAACPIHTILALASGVWVPWSSPSAMPPTQVRAPRVRIEAASPDGQFALAHVAEGVARGFWEKVEDPSDFSQCAIIEAGFVASSLKFQPRSSESAAFGSEASSVNVPAVDSVAQGRATEFLSRIETLATTGTLTKASFLREWVALNGAAKRRFCVGHHYFLNGASHRWSLVFPSAHSVLESAMPGDFFLVRDLVSAYSSVPIRPDQRRYFCFFHPVTGDVYRCLCLDFGWSLSPGVFCSLTAVIKSILEARLRAVAGSRCVSRYYIDDSCSRAPSGGGPPLSFDAASPAASLLRLARSANESHAILISADTASRANLLFSLGKDQLGEAVDFLGLRIDSRSRTAVIRALKLAQALSMLHSVRRLLAVDPSSPLFPSRVWFPLSFLQRLAGNLQWLAENFRQGRLFTPGVWRAVDLLQGAPFLPLHRCSGLAPCLDWWVVSAASNRLVPHRYVHGVDLPSLVFVVGAVVRGGAFAVTPIPGPSADGGRPMVAMLADTAGTTALGGIWRSCGSSLTHAFYAPLSEAQRAWPSIALKELLALVLWLEHFGRFYPGCLLLCGTDNFGNVYTANRLSVRAGDRLMLALLLRLLRAADACDIECLLWWCPRSYNGLSDVLSKCTPSADVRREATRLGAILHDLRDRVHGAGDVDYLSL